MKLKISERANKSKRYALTFNQKSMTEQSHRKECNINTIMAKARRTGMLPTRGIPGRFGDFTNSEEFHGAMSKIRAAESNFMEMPSELRHRFDNDPGKFLDFVYDPNNAAEMVELGLANSVEERLGGGPLPPQPPKAPESAAQEASEAQTTVIEKNV